VAGLRVLVAASEVAGFAKTGGLADVTAALPRALAKRGNLAAVVMPLYNAVRRSGMPIERTRFVLPVPMGDRVLACRVFRSHLPNTDVPIFLIEHSPFFERDDPKAGRGLYQQNTPGGQKEDYWDNGARFVFFSRAVLELIPNLGFPPDVIHANDWQTGLVPVYLRELYGQSPGFQRIRSVFTIHNIAYQGTYPRELMNFTGLPAHLYNPGQLEHYGFNFLKSGRTLRLQLPEVRGGVLGRGDHGQPDLRARGPDGRVRLRTGGAAQHLPLETVGHRERVRLRALEPRA
jgi:starch synthase